jgi:hypothetical protein
MTVIACSSSTTTPTTCGCDDTWWSKDDTCPQLESIVMEIRHAHARHHSSSGAFAPILKFDLDSVFEATATRFMCCRLGVGVQYSAMYVHPMLGKVERPWRTLRDNVRSELHVIESNQHRCVPSQPHVQPRGWCIRWRSPHTTHVVGARRVQVPCLRMHSLCLCARQAPSQAWGESAPRHHGWLLA